MVQFVDLSKISERLKAISDQELKDVLQQCHIPENSFLNTYMLNGLAKKINKIPHSEREKFFVIWGQVIVRSYAVFVLMRNDIVELFLEHLENESLLALFKLIFEKDDKTQTISTETPTGLCRRIRNSIGHGTFAIHSEKGQIMFKDYEIELMVDGYELTNFCNQIERLYVAAYKNNDRVSNN